MIMKIMMIREIGEDKDEINPEDMAMKMMIIGIPEVHIQGEDLEA